MWASIRTGYWRSVDGQVWMEGDPMVLGDIRCCGVVNDDFLSPRDSSEEATAEGNCPRA